MARLLLGVRVSYYLHCDVLQFLSHNFLLFWPINAQIKISDN